MARENPAAVHSVRHLWVTNDGEHAYDDEAMP